MSTVTEIRASQIPAQALEQLSECAAEVANPVLRELIQNLITNVAGGFDVTVLRSDAELTPSQVAAQLRMSRTHLYKVLDSGQLPSHRVGRDRRIRLCDVLHFESQRQNDRRELAERFARVDATRDGALRELLAEM